MRERSGTSSPTSLDDAAAAKLAHTTLDSRLMPFWSKAISGRRVSFAVYTMHRRTSIDAVASGPAGALFETSTFTDEQGLFAHHFVVPWERLCTHPPSIAMACHDPKDSGPSDWQVLVKAEIQDTSSDEHRASHSSTRSRKGQGLDLDSSDTEKEGHSVTSRGPRPLNDLVHQAKDAFSHAFSAADRSQMIIAVSEPRGVRVISDLVSIVLCTYRPCR